MQSDLLGAHAMGVRNVLLVTGDPPKVGDYPDATAVLDVDSIGLTNVVVEPERRPRHRRPAHRQPDRVSHRRRGESRRAESRRRAAALRLQGGGGRRVRDHAAGVRRRRVPRVRRAHPRRTRIPVLAGIMPLESARHAEFMANEVPGVRVPDARGRADAPRRRGGPRRRRRAGDRARDRGRGPAAGPGRADLDRAEGASTWRWP